MIISSASIRDIPTYGMPEAERYLKIPYSRVNSWSHKGGLITNDHPGLLSFNNLLELHVLNGLRKEHELPLQRIRKALDHYREKYDNPHPLLDPRMETDGFSLFLREGEEVVNLNRASQLAIPKIVSTYLRRIEYDKKDDVRFFPFVVRDAEDEPRNVQIAPTIAFGKPVLAGTGITTEVIAGRFLNRDSISDLAEEYGVDESKIEDALRWELPHLQNAA